MKSNFQIKKAGSVRLKMRLDGNCRYKNCRQPLILNFSLSIVVGEKYFFRFPKAIVCHRINNDQHYFTSVCFFTSCMFSKNEHSSLHPSEDELRKKNFG